MNGYRLARFKAYMSMGLLNAVVHGTKAVFVGFSRLRGLLVGVVLFEMSLIPLLHGNHGMVESGQRFLCADGVNPFIDSLLIGKTQLIESWASRSETYLVSRRKP